MDFHPPTPHHVVVAFLLHPDGIPSLEQIGTEPEINSSVTSVEGCGVQHDPFPPPRVLLIRNSFPSIPEIDNCWGGIMQPFDLKQERPFLTAVKAISKTTGLTYSSFRFIRSAAIWKTGEFGETTMTNAPAKSEEVVDVQTNLLRNPVIDIFHSPFEPEQAPIKPDVLYYPFLFQALNLEAFSVIDLPHLWATPLEVEVKKRILQDEPLATDLSFVLSTVYVSPLFNKLFDLIQRNRELGTISLHKVVTELLQRLIFDAWRVNCWLVKEPDSERPVECDELNLGAPYLSGLKARTVLIHLKAVMSHLSRVRNKTLRSASCRYPIDSQRSTKIHPAVSVINGIVRYILHFIEQGSKYLDQVAVEKQVRRLTSQRHSESQSQELLPLVKRLSFWGKRAQPKPEISEAAEQQPSSIVIENDEASIDWNKFGSFEGSKPPPRTLYDKSIGRVLFAILRYQLFMDRMISSCVSHADCVLAKAKRVIVLGGSSLVEQVACRFDKIIICEGRPLFDGVKLAERLAKEQGKGSVHVISEAQIGIFISHVDCCLVGAETILPDGSFINQVGTYLLALAAANTKTSCNRIRSVPFYVVATTTKIMMRETLDDLSTAQRNDGMILVPAQHPAALQITEKDFAWNVLPPTLISEGMSRDLFIDSEKDDTVDTDSDMEKICETGKVRLHRIDSKALFGVILEGNRSGELVKAWEAYDLRCPSNVTAENICSETIPAHLVSGYITEKGLLLPHEVVDTAKEFVHSIDDFIKENFPTWEF